MVGFFRKTVGKARNAVSGAYHSAMSTLQEGYSSVRGILGKKDKIIFNPKVDEKTGKVCYNVNEDEFQEHRDSLVKSLGTAINNVIGGNFKENDAPYLDNISKSYQDLFNTYGKDRLVNDASEVDMDWAKRSYFIGQKNKKAMLTLESLASAHAAYLKSGEKQLDFNEFLMQLFYEGDIETFRDEGDARETGRGYAVMTEYGTMHSYILDDFFKFSDNGKRKLDLLFEEKLRGKRRFKSGAHVLAYESQRMPPVDAKSL